MGLSVNGLSIWRTVYLDEPSNGIDQKPGSREVHTISCISMRSSRDSGDSGVIHSILRTERPAGLTTRDLIM